MSPNEDETAVPGVICLCACVRLWSYRGIGTCASVLKLVLLAHFTRTLRVDLTMSLYSVFLQNPYHELKTI